MELAWKHQNVVLFIITVATGKESVCENAAALLQLLLMRVFLAQFSAKTSPKTYGSHSLSTPTTTL